MRIPSLPLNDEGLELVRFSVSFVTLDGFLQVYQKMLAEHKKPGVAYEATEQLHNYFFSRRRFPDREAFYNAKSRKKK